MTGRRGTDPGTDSAPGAGTTTRRSVGTDGHARPDRGVVPVVGKAAEIGLVLLFVGLLTTTLYGGVVPDYRQGAADATAEAVLADVADRTEAAADVPAGAVRVRSTVRVSPPPSIDDAAYRIRADDGTLTLTHPDRGVGASRRLALPSAVASTSGRWTSGTDLVVRVRGTTNRLRVDVGAP